MTDENYRLRYTIYLIASSGMISVARAMSLTFLVVRLQDGFGLGAAMIGVLLGIGPLLGAVTAPFAGSLSDRIGRKRVLVFTMFSMALALAGLGLATRLAAFCLAQIVSAIAIAIYEPVSRALMSDICPQPKRLQLFSWRYTVANAGWAIGPLVAIWAGAAFVTLFLIAGAIYTLLATVLLVLPIPQVTAASAAVPASRLSVAASVKAAIHDPRLRYFLGGGTLLIAVYGQWSATIGSYLTGQIADGVAIYAYISSVNGIVVLLGSQIARRFIERTSALTALVAGCGFFIVAELGFMSSSALLGFAVSMAILTIGEILVVPSEYMLVDGIANDSNRGSYFGAHSFSSIGNSLGAVVGGSILGIFGPETMFLLFACFAVISAILFTIGTRTPPPRIEASLPQPAPLLHGAGNSQGSLRLA